MAGFYENITVSAAVPNAAADAEAAKDAAVTAKNEAEAAKDAAEVAKNLAEQHKDTASGYVGTVSGAQSIADANVASTAGDRQAAEDARDLALAYRQAANVSALSAENSANSVSANAATVAGMADDINLVAGLQNTLVTVAADLGFGNTMSTIRPYMTQIDTVSGITTEVIAVAADAPDIGTVATDLTGSNNIGTVAGLAPKINTVAGLSSELTTVHGNNADITTVANSLNAGNIIANVSSSIGNVNNVGNKLAEIEAVKNALSDIAAVENKLTEIDSVSDSITNVETVAGVISEVQTVAGVSDEVRNLSASTGNMATLVSKLGQTTDLAGAVTDAQNSATSASSSASTATTQATTASGHATTAATHAANLGSVAYQNLTAIAESKAVSAVDVFVYDTSKDSDGGAWRNRTQGTSWYNEPLNTSSRGATKKFPAVAVIVVTEDDILIYDGDDPSMPLWMKFGANEAGSSGTWWGTDYGNVNGKCVTMKDGLLCAGTTDTVNSHSVSGLSTVSFISEKFSKYGGMSGYKYRPIADRDTAFTVGLTNNLAYATSHKSTNDVAITVLPNAPIDPETGLPVPTIAVATFEGVSVIKDDGSIISKKSHLSNYNHHECDNIVFDGEDIVFNVWNNSAYHSVARWDYELTTLKSVYSTYSSIAPSDTVIKLPSGISGNGSSGKDVVTSGDNTSLAYGSFVVNVNETTGKPKESLVNVINSSYNTGWMNGDIKLATLMDTTAENISAPELVTNGDFSSFGNNLITNGEFPNNADGWTLGSNFTWDSSGRIERTSGTGNSSFSQSINIVAGKTYRVRYDVVHTGGNNPVTNQYSAWTGVNANHNTTLSGSGSVDVYITATVTGSIPFNLYGIGDFRGYWDNVVIEEVTGWEAIDGNPNVSIDNGRLKMVSNATDGWQAVYNYFDTEVGKTYAVTATVESASGNNGEAHFRGSAGNTVSIHNTNMFHRAIPSGQSQTFTLYFTATNVRTNVHLMTQINNTVYLDNVSVVEVVEDRSVNANGLNIVGNVTKSAVATGAELVKYGGFTTNNYLTQDYNSDLDFGTGDFCVMGWVKTPDTGNANRSILRWQGNTGLGAWRLRTKAGALSLWVSDDGVSTIREVVGTSSIDNNDWVFVSAVRSGNSLTLYVNGKSESVYTLPAGTNLSSSDAILYVGVNQNQTEPLLGSLALWRISATAPTAEQIAKIYRDEKPLFQEGAKCTLSGTTDNVYALDYDEDMEILHVGTLNDRDEFKGLQRVKENDVEGTLTVAISAVNGLVVEE